MVMARTWQGLLPAAVASSSTKDYPAQYKGIAPGAKIINLNVLNELGSGFTSSVLQALDWCIQNKVKYNIRVINLSLGHPVYESYKTDPLCQMVERCVANGIMVVAAAGNYGKAGDGSTVYGGITSPGNGPAVITVSAVNTHDMAARSDDTIATYSSRGPTAVDGLIKPDIVAPGNKVISIANPKCTLFNTYSNYIAWAAKGRPQDALYYIMSRTSI